MPTVSEILRQAVQLHQAGSLRQAEQLYHLALQADPAQSDAHHLLGVLAYQQGRADLAVQSIGEALALNANVPDYHFNLGLALAALGQLDAAVASYNNALRLQPDFAEAHSGIGNALRMLGNFDEAAAHCLQALQIRPDFPQAHNNLGITRLGQGRVGEAVAHLERALSLLPDFPEAHLNLANARLHEGNAESAFAHFWETLKARPDHADAHNDLALLHLLRGDFERGWPEYEWRWRQAGADVRSFAQPKWDGAPLSGKTILLHAEQGLGDTLHFIRYVDEVVQRGGKVIVECQLALVRLLNGFPGTECLVARNAQLPAFDVHAPLLGLPGIFRTTSDSIPARIPYLHADAQLVERWRLELGHLPGLKIGIAWQGNPGFPRDRQRSIPSGQFTRLADLAGISLISLQKGMNSSQLSALSYQPMELDDTAGAFMDTAAIMVNLDLVITSDTAVAHLAGALGIPVWVAVAVIPDWRWMLQREDSPWYPSMRLIRQNSVGNWNEVFERLAEQLQGLVAKLQSCRQA